MGGKAFHFVKSLYEFEVDVLELLSSGEYPTFLREKRAKPVHRFAIERAYGSPAEMEENSKEPTIE
ncbi:hypothetical protein [Alkalihalobacillus sp. TS-13]|uniref:hypothetical protein n=1 Tax=Alkalihalobacillus sp. TS-13 TaxID=2842455 RepID=UPI001C874B77|nr:hypothetical protein [Alkalihalobacillus sp. TS-13]